MVSSSSLTNSTIYDNGTNIGIGLSNPSTKLAVSGTFSTTANSYLATSSGNVGIGKTNPAKKLDVSGGAQFSDLVWGQTPLISDLDAFVTVDFAKTYIDSQKDFNCGDDLIDQDGNSYKTVQIGSQCWMAENLAVGTMLPSYTTLPNPNNQIIEKWCYKDTLSNCDTYGGIYTWDEAMQGATEEGAQGVCPPGWHIPTDREFNILERYVSSVLTSTKSQRPCTLSESSKRCCDDTGKNPAAADDGVGRALKFGSNINGSNLVGFMLKGAYMRSRDSLNNGKYASNTTCSIWTSSSDPNQDPISRTISTGNPDVLRKVMPRTSEQNVGISIRCLKD